MIAQAGTPRTLRLRDGSEVLVRPIVPEDKSRLADALARLSERSRYHRFMAAVVRLSEAQYRYLTEIDYEDHMAWIALDPAVAGAPAVGVARYVRIADEPDVAEAAVAVVDSHQGRGLGTLLLGMLAVSASVHGIQSFRSHVLAENHAMLRLFLELGSTARREDPSLYAVDMPIPRDAEDLPATPAGRVFRALARKELDPPVVSARVSKHAADPAVPGR